MTDSDQSSAAARRPHRPEGDPSHLSALSGKRASLVNRIRTLWPFRAASLRDDLQEALAAPDEGSEEDFTPSERTILQNVLKLGELRVEDVMVPRADIEAVEADISLGQVVARFREVGHSRLPVYEDDLDNVVGMIHIKDVLDGITAPAEAGANGNGNTSPVKLLTPALRQKIGAKGRKGLLRQLLFVPPSMPITDLLASMQASRVHMAIVVDEYGGTDGLVTIEDLLEAVVGNIEDEHDEDEAVLLRALNDDTFVVDARIELPDLVAAIGEDFDPGDLIEEVDTLGGLIFALVGRVPVKGEIVSKIEGFELEVTRADGRRVKQVRITRRQNRQPLLITGPEDGSPDAHPEVAVESKAAQ